MSSFEERVSWDAVASTMTGTDVVLGPYVSYWFRRSPRRALYALAYYKFASKLIGRRKRVLDVGCNEGLGTWLLAVECGRAIGVDFDESAIEIAKGNWQDPRVEFHCADFMKWSTPPCDAVVSLDVIEHIEPADAERFLSRVAGGLEHDGVAIIGTPNLNSDQYASPVTRAGHVNLYSMDRLGEEMRRRFGHVFLFTANDEVVHTGFAPMANYLIAVGCRPLPARAR